LHHCRWINPSAEAALSHLTITYAPPSTASSPAAPVGAAASAPAEENPLGFLAALLDSLLAGSEAIATTSANTEEPALATPVAEPIVPLTFANAVDAPAEPPSPAARLLARLGHQLNALQRQLDEGSPATPKQLKELGDTADALLALLANAPAAAPVVPGETPPPETGTEPATQAAADPSFSQITEPAGPAMPHRDLAAHLLAQLGVAANQTAASPPAPEQAASADTHFATTPTQILASPDAPAPIPAPTRPHLPASPQTPAEPLPALTALAGRLADTGRRLAPLAPEAAQKLASLAAALGAAATTPDQLAALAGNDPDRLEANVRQLLAEKPAPQPPATPKLAAPAGLELPAPIRITREKQTATTPTAEKPAAPVAHAPAPTPRPTVAHVDASAVPERVHLEAKAATADTAPVPAPASNDADAPPPPAVPGAGPQPAAAAAQARAVPAVYQAAQNPINMGQVAFEMVRQVHQGISRFNIRLDPPELGRVDVKMHVDAAGTLNARLTVERAETLDMFQRDRAALERALGQTGLDAGKANLEFSLRQNPFAGMGGGDHPSGGHTPSPRFALAGDGDDAAPAPITTLYRGTASAGGVNILA
jgi:flagellar hook-length control protein FliK